MDNFQTIVILMFAATILIGLSQKIRIPYPIGLVLGGSAIGLNYDGAAINFDPTLILVIVLPPILYYAAFGISYREFKNSWKDILSLSLGLVVFTTIVIGLIFKMLFPQFSWALAFAFGAIVSPPDAVAATSILKRFNIGNRLLTILEGESLVNDASALVLYRLAVVALLSGSFSFAEGAWEFLKVVTGGIAVGAILGYGIQRFSRYFLEPVVAVVFSFTIPYVTYILANYLGFSGVLAVVVNGILGSQVLLKHPSSLRRILGFASWDIFIILMNCFVFILIGLQIRALTIVLSLHDMLLYAWYGLIITLAMMAIRMMWVYAKGGISYFKALHEPNANKVCPQILHNSVVIGWSGMRGIVSLAAALALPYTLLDGNVVEGRNEVVFITFVVILLTLIIPGLTLPLLIRWLNIQPQSDHHNILKVRKELTSVAEDVIEKLRNKNKIDDHESDFLTSNFNLSYKILQINTSKNKTMHDVDDARSLIIQEQRKRLFEIWERFEIDDELLNKLEHELDLHEVHITRAQLK